MTKLRGVACARIAAVSTISTMKVERPRARLSDAPTRLNRRSTRPSVALVGGDVAAGLGEHRDQRVLAQEGRLAAHVRAGDQPQPRSSRDRPQSLATKRSPVCATRRLDHRMAPALDLEAGVIDERRPRPAALGGALGERRRRRRAGRAHRRSRRSPRGAASAAAVSSSRCAASAASAWAPACVTCIATSCSSGALKRTTPASVWRWVKPLSARHQRVGGPRRHLDMIAEHAVVADLERGDAGLRRDIRASSAAIARRPPAPASRRSSSAAS